MLYHTKSYGYQVFTTFTAVVSFSFILSVFSFFLFLNPPPSLPPSLTLSFILHVYFVLDMDRYTIYMAMRQTESILTVLSFSSHISFLLGLKPTAWISEVNNHSSDGSDGFAKQTLRQQMLGHEAKLDKFLHCHQKVNLANRDGEKNFELEMLEETTPNIFQGKQMN